MFNQDRILNFPRGTVYILFSLVILSLNSCAWLRGLSKAENGINTELANLRFELEKTRQDRDAELLKLKQAKDQDLQAALNQKNQEIQRLLADRDQQLRQYQLEKESQLTDLERAKKDLENSLSKELSDYKAKLEMTERGLVLTFLAEIFFDSGKAELRKDASVSLQKVAQVLKGPALHSNVAIEGHTDNQPIQKSNWRSNWELSTARALAVVHYFAEQAELNPQRLSAVGYGEYHPVVSNDVPKTRQQNRRVEIVILPAKIAKVR